MIITNKIHKAVHSKCLLSFENIKALQAYAISVLNTRSVLLQGINRQFLGNQYQRQHMHGKVRQ
jgi:hypothetical protein